jgi:transposase
MTRIKYSDETIDSVRTLHASGLTIVECARRTGVSLSHAGQIVRREKRTGHPPRYRVPASTIERILSLLANGEKHEWVALETGVSRSYVTRLANGNRRANSKAAE